MSNSSEPNLPDSADPSPSIRQNLTGDRNQVIGQAIDSTIMNFAGEGQVIHLTVYDNIPAGVGQTAAPALPSANQQDDRFRKVLLNKVKKYWIQDVLEKSLHTQVLVELGLEERLDAVEDSFNRLQSLSEEDKRSPLEAKNVTQVFHQMGEGRTLLILGAPGAGKTITLLRLAKDLIARAEQDLSQPMPVVLNLSS